MPSPKPPRSPSKVYRKPRLTRNPTIPEAARYLEISEYDVERLIKPEYKLEVVDRQSRGYAGGAGQPHRVLSRTDVEDERDRRERGALLPWELIIACVGTPDDIDTALEIAGLRPAPAANLLDGIAANGPNNEICIIVIPEDRLKGELDELVTFVRANAELIVLGGEFEYLSLMRECRALIDLRLERRRARPRSANW